MTDRPSPTLDQPAAGREPAAGRGLDLSAPAHALALAAEAFAAEVAARAQPGRRPFVSLSIVARPYLQNEPKIEYSISDLYGSGPRIPFPTPEAALLHYLAYTGPEDGELETAS